MKRIQIFAHDNMVILDGEPMTLGEHEFISCGLDHHIDVIQYDAGQDIGEIQWCVNYLTQRKPANDRFTSKGGWSPYFNQAIVDKFVAAHAQRKKDLAWEEEQKKRALEASSGVQVAR